jgi:RNA polymerase sigma factor (sigma-70 family)
MPATAQRGKAASSVEEERLARGAAAGDGRAFAELYERYEKRAYNLAYRITGSEPDAADATEQAFLETMMRRQPAPRDEQQSFASQLFGATRDACHDLMEQRQPGGPGEATPRDSQDEVREANLRLPARQREALALRELEGLSYGGIAALMAIAPDAVAKLIYRGRVNLSDELHGTGLAAVGAPSPECERALPLIAAREDGQLDAGSGDDAWLDSHLSGCERCTLGVEEMRRAGESYRAWAPIAALPWMLEETMAKAASLAGVDWSEEIAEAIASRSGSDSSADPDGGGERRHWRRRGAIAAAGVAALLLGSGIAAALVGDEPSLVSPRLVAESKAADGSPDPKPDPKRKKERREPGGTAQTGTAPQATEAGLPLPPIEEAGDTPAGGGASAPAAAPDPSGAPGIEPPQTAAAPKAKPTPTPQPASAPAPPPVEAQPPPPPPVEEPVPDHPSKGKGPPPGVPKGGP